MRIQQILQWEPGVEQQSNPFAALDGLYHNILMAAEAAYAEASWGDRSVVDLLRELMLYNKCSDFVEASLSVNEFERLIGLHPGQIQDMLSDLHPLVKSITVDNYGCSDLNIVFHHKSFADYLQDPSRSSAMYRSDQAVYLQLLRQTISWLQHPAIDYSIVEASCLGFDQSAPEEDAEKIHIVRFSMCYWLVYLF